MSRLYKSVITCSVILVLGACAAQPRRMAPPSETPPPVASQLSTSEVTVYSLDDAAPAAPGPAPAVPPSGQHSIKHSLFSWLHGSSGESADVTTHAPEPARAVPGHQEGSVTIYPLDDTSPAVQPVADKPEIDKPVMVTPPQEKLPALAAPSSVPVDNSAIPPSDQSRNEPTQPPAAGRLLTGDGDATVAETDASAGPAASAGNETSVAPDATNKTPATTRDPLRLYFAYNSTALGPEGMNDIQRAVTAYGINSLPLQVEGHASVKTSGDDTPVRRSIINLKVAMARAVAVTQELIRAGIPASAIQTMAFGDTRPSLPLDGKDSEEASRRVEIYSVSSQATDVVASF